MIFNPENCSIDVVLSEALLTTFKQLAFQCLPSDLCGLDCVSISEQMFFMLRSKIGKKQKDIIRGLERRRRRTPSFIYIDMNET